ncbi:MAG: hypothetical protein HY049_05540 [Acidobacteria bacterium]|nr:hypothetical protein [Acidobacteriota bacterium]
MSVRPILSIGAPANGSGKTLLAAGILAAHPGAFSAVKFTTVYRDGRNCPRTEVECACRKLHGRYTILSERGVIEREGTDTGRLTRAGASRVLWALAVPGAHAEMWRHLDAEVLAGGERLVTEGNRIIPVVDPALVVMVIPPGLPEETWKSDTWDLVARAGVVVVNARGEGAAPCGPLVARLRDRTRAAITVQDVSIPLSAWPDGTLARLASRLVDATAYPPPVRPATS